MPTRHARIHEVIGIRTARDRAHDGFTLIELVGVVAIIAVLIGLLLPAMFKVRESVSRTAAQQTVVDLCTAAVAFEQRQGRYPTTIAEIVHDTHPVADGADAGRRHTILASSPWAVVADPYPGVTGFDSAIAVAPACRVAFQPTPGAERGEASVRNGLLVAAARALSDLVGLLPADERPAVFAQLREAVDDPATQARAFEALSGTAEFSLAAAHLRLACDGSVRPVGCRFWKDVQATLHLGVYDEDWQRLPALNADDAQGRTSSIS